MNKILNLKTLAILLVGTVALLFLKNEFANFSFVKAIDHQKITNFFTILGVFGTFLVLLLSYSQNKTLKEQFENSIKPSFVVYNSKIELSNFEDIDNQAANSDKNLFFIFPKEEDSMVKIENCGFGIAKNVRIKWILKHSNSKQTSKYAFFIDKPSEFSFNSVKQLEAFVKIDPPYSLVSKLLIHPDEIKSKFKPFDTKPFSIEHKTSFCSTDIILAIEYENMLNTPYQECFSVTLDIGVIKHGENSNEGFRGNHYCLYLLYQKIK